MTLKSKLYRILQLFKVRTCVCMLAYVGASRGQKRGWEPLKLVTEGCEPPDWGAGNQTLVFCKSRPDD